MKIKKKTMNKIHNEMRCRFSPFWERQNTRVTKLENVVIELQNAVKTLQGEQVQMDVQEASAGDRGRHVAKPETEKPELPEIWEARFSIFGGAAVATIPSRYIYSLKNLGIQHFVSGSASNPNMIRVQLLMTMFPGKVEALQEQMTRLMRAPVKIHWRKVQ